MAWSFAVLGLAPLHVRPTHTAAALHALGQAVHAFVPAEPVYLQSVDLSLHHRAARGEVGGRAAGVCMCKHWHVCCAGGTQSTYSRSSSYYYTLLLLQLLWFLLPSCSCTRQASRCDSSSVPVCAIPAAACVQKRAPRGHLGAECVASHGHARHIECVLLQLHDLVVPKQQQNGHVWLPQLLACVLVPAQSQA
jgi:hypothetical protein